MNKKLQINCAKGVAIIIIVLSHLMLANTYTPVSFAPLLGFCVPMFFYCTGYEYVVYRGTLGKELRVRVLRLLMYALGVFLLFVAIQSIILYFYDGFDFVSCLKSLFLLVTDESALTFFPEGSRVSYDYKNILCPYWFIFLFVLTLLIFIVVVKILRKNKYAGIAATLILLIVSALIYCFAGVFPAASHLAPSFTFVMLAAYLIKEFKIEQMLEKLNFPTQLIINLAIFIIGEIIASQIGLEKIARGRFAENDASFLCWLMGMMAILLCSFSFVNLSIIFTKIKGVSQVLSWGGVNALDILLVHMFFATEFSKFTGIPNGRWFFDSSQITPQLQIQFFLVLVVSISLTAGYIYLKKYFFRKRALNRLSK